MTWTRNVREKIELISPNGASYQALWRGNERTFDKKLGRFDIPRFKGTIVQDLGPRSWEYPLTIFFEGSDHDEQADEFLTTLYEEDGQWEVLHPTKGTIALQLVSVSEAIQPIENGNYTEISTQWVEPANVDILLSTQELETSILDQIIQAQKDFISGLQSLRSAAYATVQAAINAFQKVTGFANKVLGELTKTVALVQDTFNSISSSLTAAIAQYDISNTDPGTIGALLQQLVGEPANVSTDFATRKSYYDDFITEAETVFTDNVTEEDINTAIVTEFSILSAFTVFCNICVTSEYNSRADVVTVMNSLADTFQSIVVSLDEQQDKYRDNSIDFQFFSNLDGYTSITLLFQQTQRYLLNQFYNLRAEKRFTLKNDRSPIEITVTEYGTLGEDDENYDLFLTSNKLEGNDILLLRAGTEVVVYV